MIALKFKKMFLIQVCRVIRSWGMQEVRRPTGKRVNLRVR